jgi:hypothetical protein
MTFTKEEALKVCIEMWDELAKNPTLHKHNTIAALAFEQKHGRSMEPSCACCEYVGDKGCKKCPMLSVWGRGGNVSDAPCCNNNSPFRHWLRARHGIPKDIAAASDAAQRIADGARAELAKLKTSTCAPV